MTKPLWIELYACTSYERLIDLYVRHLSQPRQAVHRFLEQKVSPLVPGWRTVALTHLTGYRTFVDHWLTDQLTAEDWARAGAWAKADPGLFFARLFTEPHTFSFTHWMIHEYKKNPLQPFEAAYRQVLALIAQEHAGTLPFRPQYCPGCGTLFFPDRQSQRWCSARCRTRMLQRQYRAAHKAASKPSAPSA